MTSLFTLAVTQTQLPPNYGDAHLREAERLRKANRRETANTQPGSVRKAVAKANREAILRAITACPGLRLAQIQRATGLTLGAAKHNLDGMVLRREVERRGDPAQYFPVKP